MRVFLPYTDSMCFSGIDHSGACVYGTCCMSFEALPRIESLTIRIVTTQCFLSRSLHGVDRLVFCRLCKDKLEY